MPTPLAQKDKGIKNLYTILDVPLEDPLDDPLNLPSFDDCFDNNSDISVKSFLRNTTRTRSRDHSPVPDRLSLIRKAKAPLSPIPVKEDSSTHHTSIPIALNTSGVTTPLSKPMAATYNFPSQHLDKTSTIVVNVKGTVLPEIECHESSNTHCLKKERRQLVEKVGADSLPRTPARSKLPRNRDQSPERMAMNITSTLLDHSKILEEDLDRLLDNFRPPSPEPWDFMEELKKSGSSKKVTPTKTNKDPYEHAAELLAAEKKAVSSVKSKKARETKRIGDPENKPQGEPSIKLLDYVLPPVIAQSMIPIIPIITAQVASAKAFPPSSDVSLLTTSTSFPTSTAPTTTDLSNTATTSMGYGTPTPATRLQHEHLEQTPLKAISHHKMIPQGPPVTPRKHLPKSRLPLKQFHPQEQNKGINKELTTNNTAFEQVFKKNSARELPLTKNHRTPIYPVASELERNRKTQYLRVRREGLNDKQHAILEDAPCNEQLASIQTWTGIVARETREAACLNGLSPVRKTFDEWNFMDRLFESKIAEIPRIRLDFNPKSHLLTPVTPHTPFKGQDKDNIEGKEGGNCDGDNVTVCSVDSLALTESGFYLDRCFGKKVEYLDIDIVYSDMSLDHNTFRQTLELQLLLEMIIERSGYDDFEDILWEFGDSDLLPLV
jgi:hypothetical protein